MNFWVSKLFSFKKIVHILHSLLCIVDCEVRILEKRSVFSRN